MSKGSQLKEGFYRIELNTVWEVPERYQLLAPVQAVGSGAYGQVCSALDKQTNFKVAIKKLARPFQSAIHAKQTYRELRMLKHMQHENVIGLLDVFTPTSKFEEFEDVYMVTALMDADMNNIIKTQRLSDDHVQFLVYQVLRAMKYIHSAGIIHRDLKPSNIGVNEDCELKILDFGLARHTYGQISGGYVEVCWYRAPEIMLHWMHYNQTVDIWSVGCIMAEMLTGHPLFPGTDNIDQLTKILSLVGSPCSRLLDKIKSEARNSIKSMPKWDKKDFKTVFMGANPLAIDLLEKMLDLDVDTRITAEQALAHPYLRQYADPSDEATASAYDQSYEDLELPIPEWRRNVYDEVMSFKQPDPRLLSQHMDM